MLNRNRMFFNHRPRLRFLTDPITPEGTPGAVTTPPVVVDLGFPADTAIADMTDKEQAAYWKHHSRRHEATVNSQSDYAEQKAKAARLDALEAEKLTDQEKAVAAARKEGETSGVNRYLADAVSGRLEALTGKTADELAVVLELVDVTKFTTADGTLDAAKLTSFAATLGTKAAADPDVPPSNPAKDALDRQRSSSTPATGGSIAEATKLRVAALTPTPNK